MSAAAEAAHHHPGEAPAHIPVIDSRFAHALAHEIRSPLTAVQMCAETLSAGEDEETRRKYCGIIIDQARFIAWALDDLIALADAAMWSRAERREVDLAELAERSMEEIERLARARGVEMDTRLRSVVRPTLAWGVPAALRQMVRCSLQTMLNHASSGGSLQVNVLSSGHAALPAGMVGMVVKAGRPPEDFCADGDMPVPWHRIALITAARIVGEHGGLIGDMNGDGPGIQVLLPTRA